MLVGHSVGLFFLMEDMGTRDVFLFICVASLHCWFHCCLTEPEWAARKPPSQETMKAWTRTKGGTLA